MLSKREQMDKEVLRVESIRWPAVGYEPPQSIREITPAHDLRDETGSQHGGGGPAASPGERQLRAGRDPAPRAAAGRRCLRAEGFALALRTDLRRWPRRTTMAVLPGTPGGSKALGRARPAKIIIIPLKMALAENTFHHYLESANETQG